jgi:hypothetical protein
MDYLYKIEHCQCGWTFGRGWDKNGVINEHCFNEECSNSYQHVRCKAKRTSMYHVNEEDSPCKKVAK